MDAENKRAIGLKPKDNEEGADGVFWKKKKDRHKATKRRNEQIEKESRLPMPMGRGDNIAMTPDGIKNV